MSAGMVKMTESAKAESFTTTISRHHGHEP